MINTKRKNAVELILFSISHSGQHFLRPLRINTQIPLQSILPVTERSNQKMKVSHPITQKRINCVTRWTNPNVYLQGMELLGYMATLNFPIVPTTCILLTVFVRPIREEKFWLIPNIRVG